jgi:hypothetical protein
MIRGNFLYHGENEQNNSFQSWFLRDPSLLMHSQLRSVRGGLLMRGQKDLCPHLEMEKLNCIVLRAHLIRSAQIRVSLDQNFVCTYTIGQLISALYTHAVLVNAAIAMHSPADSTFVRG